jgi:hypothetical protein
MVTYDDDEHLFVILLSIATHISKDFVSRHALKERTIPAISKHIENTIETFLATKAASDQNGRGGNNFPEDESKTINTGSQSQSLPSKNDQVDSSIRSLSDLTETKLESIEVTELGSAAYIQRIRDEPVAPFVQKDVIQAANIEDMSMGNLYPPAVDYSMDNPMVRSSLSEGIALSSQYKGRSIPLTIDPRQFQENIDRNMDLRSFSYPKIAAELIASASSEAKDKRDLHDHTTLRSDAAKFKYYDQSAQPVQHAWQQLQLQNTFSADGLDDSQRPSMASKTQPPDEDDKQDENVSDDLSVSHSASDLDSGGLDSRKIDDSEVLREFDPEEMYNRIRDAYYAAPPRASQSMDERSQMNTTATRNSIAPLKPSSNSMQLYSARLQPETNRHRLVGKSANERLYISAQMRKEKQLRLEKQKSDELTSALAKKQFKVNEASERMLRSFRPAQQRRQPVCDRLHDDGVLEKKIKLKRAEDMKEQLQHREWSCAKCGKMHSVSRAQVQIQPLHQVLSNALLSSSRSEDKTTDNAPDQICSSCNWNQSHVERFRPVNIGLVLAQDIPGSSIEPDEMSLNKRWHGREDSDGLPHRDNSVHDYLYANARTKQGISQLNRALYEESNPDLTFSPRIPEASKVIIDKYKQANLQQQTQTQMLSQPTSPGNSYLQYYDSEKIKANTSSFSSHNMISGEQLGTYFSMPTTERLATTKLLANNAILMASMNNSLLQHNASVEHRPSRNPEEFTNRLVYEYKEKSDRLSKKREELLKYDPRTGQQLFRPKIGPAPDETSGYAGRSTTCDNRTDVFEKIMFKDEQLKSKRKEAEEQAIKKQMADLAAMKAKPLDSSKSILEQSNKRNAKELFAVLLHAQQELIVTNPALFQHIDDVATMGTEVLFLDYVDTACMLDHVAKLVNNIKRQQLKQQQSSKPYPANGVTFDDFKRLALVCVNLKEGPGKGYICVPHKVPETALQMIKAQESEMTFAPFINEVSKQLCAHRIDRNMLGMSVESLLKLEGEKAKLNLEEMRREAEAKQRRELTFKPTLFKPPSYVKPKYRGMELVDHHYHQSGGDEENEEEEDASIKLTDATASAHLEGYAEDGQRDAEIHRLASGSTITSASHHQHSATTAVQTELTAAASTKHHKDKAPFESMKRTSSSSPQCRTRSLDNFSSPLSHASDDDLTINTLSTRNDVRRLIDPKLVNSNHVQFSRGGSLGQSISLMQSDDHGSNATDSRPHAQQSSQQSLPPPLPHELQKIKSTKGPRIQPLTQHVSNASRSTASRSDRDKATTAAVSGRNGPPNNKTAARLSSVSAISSSNTSTSIKKYR